MRSRCLHPGVLTPLTLLVIIIITGVTLPAWGETPEPPGGSKFPLDNDPLDPSAILAEAPAPFPDPYLRGGAPPISIPVAPSGDDRDNSIPTAWLIWAHQTAAQVTNTINSGYRLVDIYVESFTPSYLFTAAYVANSGTYAKAWWWYYGIDGATLASYLSANSARLISLKAYDIGSGQIRFTAIMISNTGADASAWWWYYNVTPTDISSFITANSARLTQINAYQIGGVTRYAVVMVDNTGVASKSWWWYYNISPATVSSYVQTNNARLMDIDINPVTGNLNVIMYSCASGCPYWWWFVGVAESQLLDLVNQYGARIIDVNDYTGCGGTCYDILLINNSNAITTRVGELLRNGTDGTKGLYLEQVGGNILANLMNYYPFEPASTLKVAPHLYTHFQFRDNPSINPNTLIPRYQPPATGSCPSNTIIGNETLQIADQEMMWHSDNTRTREIVDYFGVTNINSMMSTIGMTDSSINHVFGCGGPTPNQTTLDDLASLYRGVANGSLLTSWDRALFYTWMAGTPQFIIEGYDWTAVYSTDIPAIIDQEAPNGMPAVQKDAYWDDTYVVYKAGNYKLCTSEGCATYVDHISIFGYAKIPFCDAGGPRQYVFGIFIYNATSDTDSSDTFSATKSELLREQIRYGLASCFKPTYFPLIRH